MSLGGEVGAEASTNNSVVAVGLGDTTPDDANVRSVGLLLRPVDVGDALAEVEIGVRAVLDTIKADERPLRLLVVMAPEERVRNLRLKFKNEKSKFANFKFGSYSVYGYLSRCL